MTVRVQFYAQLRDLAGQQELQVEIVPGATIHDLLEEVYRQKPALRSYDKNTLIGAGVDFVERNYQIKAGEEISVMPPVQGG
ncbi:MAG: molybdopterin synthase sulfur carrier subunit [Verrucomicrobiota bacterium]|jgi:MoaD family protein